MMGLPLGYTAQNPSIRVLQHQACDRGRQLPGSKATMYQKATICVSKIDSGEVLAVIWKLVPGMCLPSTIRQEGINQHSLR